MRTPAASGALLFAVVILSGCGDGGGSVSSVPPEFRAACGHPGAHVKVRHVPVTIRHAECDLTGVALSYLNYGGASVPKQPGGVGNSSGFTLEVAPGSLDVTIDATGTPGNG